MQDFIQHPLSKKEWEYIERKLNGKEILNENGTSLFDYLKDVSNILYDLKYYNEK